MTKYIKIYLQLLVAQTIIYSLLYCMCFTDVVTPEGKKVVPYIILIVYLISISIVSIFPILKILFSNLYKKIKK